MTDFIDMCLTCGGRSTTAPCIHMRKLKVSNELEV